MKLRKRGFTLTEILIVVAIIVILAAVALPNLLRSRIYSNEQLAVARLITISAAAEEYARDHSGNYPANSTILTDNNYLNTDKLGQSQSPNISQDVVTTVMNGYNITCGWSSTEYNCTATPVRSVTANTKIAAKMFTITTGGKLSERDVIIESDGTMTISEPRNLTRGS